MEQFESNQPFQMQGKGYGDRKHVYYSLMFSFIWFVVYMCRTQDQTDRQSSRN